MKKWVWVIIGLAAAAVIGYFVYTNINKAKTDAAGMYQTTPLERGEFTAIVGATGTVRANQSTNLTWQTSGRIASINVEIGDAVSEGEILAELEKDSVSQNIILAQSELVSAKRALDQLQNSEVAKAQAQLTLAQAEKALEDAQKKANSLELGRASEATLDSARASYVLAQDNVERLEDIFSGMAHLPEDNPERATMLSQLSAARQQRDRTLANLNWLLGKPDAIEVANTEANLELATARLEDARREWERLKDGADPDDLAAAQARVDSIEATISLLAMEAPFSGVVTVVNNMAGDQVSPGTVSFRIDDLSSLLVDVQIPEVDINRIKVGNPVRISFDAINGKEYSGSVTKVGRVGMTGQGIVNFMITIELDDPDEEVLPGMTAAVSVVVKQIENTLLIPNQAVRTREGKRVVYILMNGVPEARSIELGSTSEVYSELISGEVKEGDLIVLNPPSEMMFPMQMR